MVARVVLRNDVIVLIVVSLLVMGCMANHKHLSLHLPFDSATQIMQSDQ